MNDVSLSIVPIVGGGPGRNLREMQLACDISGMYGFVQCCIDYGLRKNKNWILKQDGEGRVESC